MTSGALSSATTSGVEELESSDESEDSFPSAVIFFTGDEVAWTTGVAGAKSSALSFTFLSFFSFFSFFDFFAGGSVVAVVPPAAWASSSRI